MGRCRNPAAKLPLVVTNEDDTTNEKLQEQPAEGGRDIADRELTGKSASRPWPNRAASSHQADGKRSPGNPQGKASV
jgi:hypothetical protein